MQTHRQARANIHTRTKAFCCPHLSLIDIFSVVFYFCGKRVRQPVTSSDRSKKGLRVLCKLVKCFPTALLKNKRR